MYTLCVHTDNLQRSECDQICFCAYCLLEHKTGQPIERILRCWELTIVLLVYWFKCVTFTSSIMQLNEIEELKDSTQQYDLYSVIFCLVCKTYFSYIYFCKDM